MSEEEIKILEDFVNNENTKYCYDWQGFNHEVILPLIDKSLKLNKELKSQLDNIKASYETQAEAKFYEFKKEYESRSDNVLNELKSWLEEENENIKPELHGNIYFNPVEKLIIRKVQDKLKKLKGSDNSERKQNEDN